MRRISAANTAPGNLFRDANPGSGQRATSLSAQWCNDVQENLMKVIEARGGSESAAVDALYKAIVDVAHPVTSYLVLEREDSPAVDWPWTTWVEVRGRVLVGLDPEQVEFNAIGKEIGAKTHTLIVAEMPGHTHANVNGAWISADNGSAPQAATLDATGTGSNTGRSANTTSAGGGAAHNNLQPSRVVRLWRRTA